MARAVSFPLFALLAIGAGAAALLPLWGVLAVIGAAAALAGAIWLDAGYALYVASLYFILLIKRLASNAPVGLAADGLLVILVVGVALRLSRTWRTEPLRLSHPIVGVVLLYFGYQIADAFNPSSLNWLFSAYAVRQTFPALSVFVLTVFLMSSIHKVQRFVVLWFVLAATVGLYALKQQFFGFYWREWAWMYSPEGQVWKTAEGVVRVFSTMVPDTAAITMAYALIVGLALLLGSPIRVRLKVVLLALMPVFAFAMLFTGTRSAYAAALVGSAVVVLLLRRWWLYVLAPLMVAATMTLVDFSSDYWGTRFVSVFKPEQDSSYLVRQSIIDRYLPDALARPFGIGTATTSYADFARDQFRAAQGSGLILPVGANVPTDNNYFQAIVELGVAGEILLLLALGVGLFYATRLALMARDRYVRCLAIGLCGCLAASAFASVSNNYLGFWGTWLIVGLICALDQLANGSAPPTRGWAHASA